MVFLYILLLVIFIISIRFILNDSCKSFDILDGGINKNVLIIFAHPDDEAFIGGTLKKLHTLGANTFLLTLTNGERGKCKSLIDKQTLSITRTGELEKAISELSISDYKICKLPDYDLKSNKEGIKNEILLAIDKWQPQIIITHDHKIGLYGHPDHIAVASSLLELLRMKIIKIEQVYGVTHASNLIRTVALFNKCFNQRILTCFEALPKPEFSINIFKYALSKRKAILAHRTQLKTLQKAFPLITFHFIALIYFSIFDREYFYRLKILD